MSILGKIFTWWDGATVGTLLNSWSTGEKVGNSSKVPCSQPCHSGGTRLASFEPL